MASIETIPVIDLGPYLADEKGALDRTAKELRFALTEIGFYFITNHGVPSEKIRATFEQVKRFHAQPDEKKLALKIDQHSTGYMQITDRSKDVIKSGGEWISSIDLENAAMAHPAVAEAAVIGVAHPKWDERPLLIVQKKEDAELDKKELIDFLAAKVAKWWLPDDVQFVETIPHTATGKILKTRLREDFKGYRLPTA